MSTVNIVESTPSSEIGSSNSSPPNTITTATTNNKRIPSQSEILTASQSQVPSSSASVSSVHTHNTTTINSLPTSNVQISHLTNMVQLLTEQLSQFEHQLHEAVEEALEWKNSSENWEQQYYTVITQQQKQQDSIFNYQQQIEVIRKQSSDAQEQLYKLIENNHQLTEQTTQLKAENNLLHQEIQENYTNLAKLQQHLEELIKEHNLQNKDHEIEQQKYTELQKNYNEVQEENKILKNQIKILQTTVIEHKQNLRTITKDNEEENNTKVSESSSNSPTLARISSMKLRVRNSVNRTRSLSATKTPINTDDEIGNSPNNKIRSPAPSTILNSPIDSVGFFTPVGSPLLDENIDRPVTITEDTVSTKHSETIISPTVNKVMSTTTNISELANIQAELAASTFLLQRDSELIEQMRNSIIQETSLSNNHRTNIPLSNNIISIIEYTLDELHKGRNHHPSSSPLSTPKSQTTSPNHSVTSPKAGSPLNNKSPLKYHDIVSDKELHDTLLPTINSPELPELSASTNSTLQKIQDSRKHLDDRWNAIMGSYRSG